MVHATPNKQHIKKNVVIKYVNIIGESHPSSTIRLDKNKPPPDHKTRKKK